MAGTRRDRYYYAGMAFILGIVALIIALVAYLLGNTLVGEILAGVGIVSTVGGFLAARLGGGPRTPT